MVPKSRAQGILIVSAELPHADSLPPNHGRTATARGQAFGDLLMRFETLRIPGTWAVDGRFACHEVKRLLAVEPEQEVALLADPSWASPAAPRRRFAVELSERVSRARSAGFVISTLAISGGSGIGQPDLAMKYGITAIRPGSPGATSRRWLSWLHSGQTAGGPQFVRYGLWEIAPSVILPGEAGRATSRAVLRTIDRAAAEGGVSQIVVDVAGLARRRRTWKTLDTALRHADRLRRGGSLEIAPLRLAVERLGQRQRSPARSILRPAA